METIQDGDYTIQIEYDHEDICDTPREWDNLGIMVCWHRKYQLGDKHNWSTPEDFQEYLLADLKDRAIVLPLYLYDHSGITISTRPFSCPWDSGQVGYIYAEYDTILSEYKRKRINAALLQRATDCLRGEVDIYDQYLRGEIYCYTVQYEGEVIDSCHSYYGEDDAVSDAQSFIAYHKRQIAKETRETAQRISIANASLQLYLV